MRSIYSEIQRKNFNRWKETKECLYFTILMVIFGMTYVILGAAF